MEIGNVIVDHLLYRLVIEQAKDYAVFVLDPKGYVITWNDGAQRIKGYASDEIIGRHFSVFYPREAIDSRWPEKELESAATEGRFEDEGWRIRKDGSRFWANVIITALRDENGKLVAFSKITRDLTERKRHEEALRLSEERFRLLVDGVVDYAIFMLDPEGIVTSWSTGAERIEGYSRQEIVGKHFSRFYPREDVDAGKPWEELARARRTGRAEDEGWQVRKNGERFWARVVLSVLCDSAGRLIGFAQVTQDLTERRYLQDLEKAAKGVNEFIAVLAHELRNPLAPIRSAVEVMAMLPADDPAHEAMRQMIDRQSAQLVRIVDDMIDIIQVSRGALSIEHASLDVGDVLHLAAETATPAIDAGKHRLDIELPANGVRIHGDVHRLTQVITNLLNNAARYTPEGGSIRVSARAEPPWAVIAVRDNGRGIEPELIDRIFDMFVQGRGPLERVGRGLGIGLALARRIAELHGGSLQARSDGAGKGSEFTLRVPLASTAQASPDAHAHGTPEPKDGPLVPRRVLVVDDNIDAAATLDLLLKSLGHDTCVVHDGIEALEAAVAFRPDVVLLDIGLPGISGYEVAKQLRVRLNDHSFRIVAVTGWGQETDRDESHEAGFDLHLVKPIDASDLLRALDERDGSTLH